MTLNPTTLIDGYKSDHIHQYPWLTEFIESNVTARGSRIPGTTSVTMLGLQPFLQRYLMDALVPFFTGNADEWCAKYERRMAGYLGPNNIGSEHIRAWHDLGYTPLEFRSFPEGSQVPLRVPAVIVENTLPEFYWLVNYYETLMSSCLWPSITSATSARKLRKMLLAYAELTNGSPEAEGFVDFQAHDFSFRGMMGPEAACMSGIGHLLSFAGTDTVPAIDWAEDYYPGSPDDYLIGCSVPATEHSVMCAGGNGEGDEMETFRRLLNLYPTGIVSVVSDTWDLWNVLTNILPKLKNEIMGRDGKLVIRPDSGNPVDILCGDESAPVGSPAYKGVFELLWEVFGGTETAKGYRELDSHIGAIYGDSITYDRASEILHRLERKRFYFNGVLGIGSFTYQYVTRDTHEIAMKATWAQVDGKPRDLFKDPVTDSGMKRSAKGRLAVLPDPTGAGQPTLINQATPEQEAKSLLQPVWRDGQFLVRESFETVRNRSRS